MKKNPFALSTENFCRLFNDFQCFIKKPHLFTFDVNQLKMLSLRRCDVLRRNVWPLRRVSRKIADRLPRNFLRSHGSRKDRVGSRNEFQRRRATERPRTHIQECITLHEINALTRVALLQLRVTPGRSQSRNTRFSPVLTRNGRKIAGEGSATGGLSWSVRRVPLLARSRL